MGQINNFVYYEFRNKYKGNKPKTFFKYIESKYYNKDKITMLIELNEQDIMDSLDSYIATGMCKYQITAQNYFTDVNKIFNDLSNIYSIENPLFSNIPAHDKLSEKIKSKAEELRKSELREIASDDEFISVYKGIQSKMQQIKDEVARSSVLENLDSFTKKHHLNITSLIATGLVFDFGLKNQVVIDLKVDDYDHEKNTFLINGIEIPLKDNYKVLMEMYLSITRRIVLNKNNRTTEYLLVNTKGEKYSKIGEKKAPDYNGLFKVLNDLTKSNGTSKYAYYRIVQMVDCGIDAITISKLTGYGLTDVVFKLLEYYYDEVSSRDPSDYFVDINTDDDQIIIDVINDKFINCPVCNRPVSVKAQDWMVVSYKDNEEPILACKYCEGEYERSII